MKSNGAWDSAAEARQQKLLEYLAAKGKLKPPNPKPYLRDRTNRLQSAQSQPTKVRALPLNFPVCQQRCLALCLHCSCCYWKPIKVVLQKENLHGYRAKTKARPAVLTGRPTDPPLHTSNVKVPQKLRPVSQKAHYKAAPYSQPSQAKVPQRSSSRIKERVGSSTTLRYPRNVVFSQKLAVEKLPKLLKDPVCFVSTVPKTLDPSHDEQTVKVLQVQHSVSCNDPCIYKCPPSKDKAKGAVAQNHNRRTYAINTHPPNKSVRNTTVKTTSENRMACTNMKSNDSVKTSNSVAPTKLCGKTVSKKVLQGTTSSTLLPRKGKSESKSAIEKSSLSVAKGRMSTSDKSWSTKQTETASVVKLKKSHTAPPCVVKNSVSATRKTSSRSGVISCMLNKSKDTVLHKHTEDNSTTTVSDRPPNRRPMFYTPAPVSAPSFPRNAVTDVKAMHDGKTGLTAEEIRRNRLNDWMNSKGKSYKRPPMILPPKKSVKKKPRLSFWAGIEEEDELNSLADNITRALSECLRLVEEGFPLETVEKFLSKIPQCEKFAKYWICKAKLLERCGTFDVIGLYEQAVRVGATPIEELREAIFNIMKNINQKPKVVKFGPLPDEKASVPAEPVVNIEQSSKVSDVLPSNNATRGEDQSSANILTRQWLDEQGSALKFKIAKLPRVKEPAVVREWKMLTPVRRSLRIERSVSFYPETLREHDTVVSSLNDLLDTEENDCFVYRENEALPKEIDSKIRALKANPNDGH